MTNRLADEAAYFGAVADGAASRDAEIAELRKQLAERDAEVATLNAEKFEAGNNQTIFMVRVAELRQQLAESENLRAGIEMGMDCSNAEAVRLRQQLAEALSACKTKDELIEKFRRAIGDHCVPNDCYATGPLTGNECLDLVQCPACSALAAYEEAMG